MDLPVFKMTKGQDIKLQRQMQLRFPKDSHLNRAYFDTKKAKYIVVYWRDCGLSLDMSPKTLRFRKKKKKKKKKECSSDVILIYLNVLPPISDSYTISFWF